jgi:hypothetical protein
MATHHGLGDQHQHLSCQGAAAIALTFCFIDSQGGYNHVAVGAADPERWVNLTLSIRNPTGTSVT